MVRGDNRWTDHRDLAHTDLNAYVDLLNNWSHGRLLPDGMVPADEFWIIDDDVVVGEIDVRRRLTPYLSEIGGQIGYLVHPEHRNRGVATFALRSALDILKNLGWREVVITCLDDNAASARVIEKCGGKRIADSKADWPLRRRYIVYCESVEFTDRSIHRRPS